MEVLVKNPFEWPGLLFAALTRRARTEIRSLIQDMELEINFETERPAELKQVVVDGQIRYYAKGRLKVMPDAMVKKLKEKTGR